MAIRVPRMTLSRKGVFHFRFVRPASPPEHPNRREICVSLRTRNPIEARSRALLLNHWLEGAVAHNIDKKTLDALLAHAIPYTIKLKDVAVELNTKQDRDDFAADLQREDSLGEFLRTAATQALQSATSSPPVVAELPKGAQKVTLQDAIERYRAHLKNHGVSSGTADDKCAKLVQLRRWLIECAGVIEPGYPFEVTELHVSDFVTYYKQNGGRGREVGSKTIAGLYGLLNDFFETLRSTLKLTASNPASGFSSAKTKAIRSAKEEHEPYKAFSGEQIRKIFEPELYYLCMSQADMFWCPLIALFTGARREEIAALRLSDFREEVDGERRLWVFEVRRRGTERRLKNSNSARIVPICDALVQIGLVEYVQHLRTLCPNEPDLDLFPNRVGKNKKGNKLGEKFGEYLKRLGMRGVSESNDRIDDEVGRITFHSFRHTAISALVALGVPPQRSMQIVGHLSQSDLLRYGYVFSDAGFSASPHHSTYDSSATLRFEGVNPRAALKSEVDKLHAVYRLDLVRLREMATRVIAGTKFVGGKLVSGQKTPNHATLQAMFPTIALVEIVRNRAGSPRGDEDA